MKMAPTPSGANGDVGWQFFWEKCLILIQASLALKIIMRQREKVTLFGAII